ncbi:MAG: type I-D CRISPR-associated helicase Cas3' [Candidatus Sericytochromatia bacterium]
MDSLTLFLEPNYEKFEDNIPERVKEFFNKKDAFFMKHQIDTYNANKEYDIVFNTYPTGTGKTRASLLHILDKPNDNVLFIAPTNELIRQHSEDIKSFIRNVGFKHNIIELNALIIKTISEDSDINRKGELLYRLLSNPLSEEFIDKLNIDNENIDYSAPFILVTNPDIFYYAITFGYNHNDKRNIFHLFFTNFNYIVIDEFHYYNPKQLCCFLFFFTLYLEFGYFDKGNRKITLLTATPLPQVLSYFERLKDKGLKYLVLSPEKISPDDKNSIRTLSKVKLTFQINEEFFSKNIQKNINFIKEKTSNKFDGVIISNSLVNINDCKFVLKENNINKFGEITGVTDKNERKKGAKENLILATPTVDIGYNFDRDKTRQNIDYLIFDFRYEDQFWQRLGRAGRILGKSEKDFLSEVIVFVSSDILSKIKNVFSSNQLIFRNDLMYFTKKEFSPREDFFNYINFYGITEMARPINNLRAIFPKDKENIIKENLFDTVSEVFCGKKKNYFHSIQKFVKRLDSLEKSDKNIRAVENGKSDEIKDIDIELANEFSSKFSNFQHIKNLDSLKNFIREELFFIKGLYNFRESFQGITGLIYDPNKLMGASENRVFSYDLFHLLKYYELEFYSSKNDFIKENNLKIKDLDKENIFCKINKRLDDNLNIIYSHKSNLEKEVFEELYLNKVTAKNNIDFKLRRGNDKISSDLRLNKAEKILNEQYIPCMIINHKFMAECIKNNIYPIKFEVTFKNGFKQDYYIILGTNIYFLSSKPKFLYLSEFLEKKIEFYIC